jgi:tricorn protease
MLNRLKTSVNSVDASADLETLLQQLSLSRGSSEGLSTGCQGYYRCPAIRNGKVGFISEDDVFVIDQLQSGAPNACRRLTTCGECESVAISRDGNIVAFSSAADGESEVYLVPFCGGPPKQLTFCGDDHLRVLDFDRGDPRKLYVLRQQTTGVRPSTVAVSALDITTGSLAPVEYGEASVYQPGKSGAVVIGRHTRDPHLAEWKHYKGGNIGQLWLSVNAAGERDFVRVCREFNVGSPQLCEATQCIYFIADPEDNAPGNVYAFDLAAFLKDGAEVVEKLTDHTDFYARKLAICSESKQLIYQSGGDLYVLNLPGALSGSSQSLQRKVDMAWNSFGQTAMRRTLDEPCEFFRAATVHPDGHLLCATVRGRLFEMPLFGGPAIQIGDLQGVRYGKATYLRCGRIAAVSYRADFDAPVIELFESPTVRKADNEYDSREFPKYVEDVEKDKARAMKEKNAKKAKKKPADRGGEENAAAPFKYNVANKSVSLTFDNGGHKLSKKLDELDPLGRPWHMVPSPKHDALAVINNREELLLVRYPASGSQSKLAKCSLKYIDKALYEDGLDDLTFSPCGNYLGYCYKNTLMSSIIRVANVKTGKVHNVTAPSYYMDSSPAFDPSGRYLFFLSNRRYCPVEDDVWDGHITFPSSDTVMFATLQNNTPSPFLRKPERPAAGDSSSEEDDDDDESSESEEDSSSSDGSEEDGWVDEGEGSSGSDSEDDPTNYSTKQPVIDFNGIGSRVGMFPNLNTSGFRIRQLQCVSPNKVTYVRDLVMDGKNKESCAYDSDEEEEANGTGTLACYNIDKCKESLFGGRNIVGVQYSMDYSTGLVFKVEDGERIVSAYGIRKMFDKDGSGDSSDDDSEDEGAGGRKVSGQINIEDRVRVEIVPREEWRQMFAEAWQVTKSEIFGKGGLDWKGIYAMYAPLLERINTREEFSDLLLELLSELRCSHAYENKGDFDAFAKCSEGNNDRGFLGIDVEECTMNDGEKTIKGNRIVKLYKGDSWSLRNCGPLARPGIGIKPGDVIFSVNHRELTTDYSLPYALRGMAGKEVYLGVLRQKKQKKKAPANGKGKGKSKRGKDKTAWAEENPGKGKKGGKRRKGKGGKRNGGEDHQKKETEGGQQQTVGAGLGPELKVFRVRCVSKDVDDFIRYKDSVAELTNYVHEKSRNKCGYVHVPNMDTVAYIQWSRCFLVESQRDAIIVDIRGNGGGSISHLLLEKLNTKCVGIEVPRYGRPEPFPIHLPSRKQVIVLLVDEESCSDADVCAHAFRAYGLGTIVGTRTWGGVVGISQSSKLVDGTEVAHPSCGYYGIGKGYGIENCGVSPDISVEVSPSDHKKNNLPQLNKALEVVRDALSIENKQAGAFNFKSILRDWENEKRGE